MTLDTLNMIRRGWQDGASSVAPNVPGLADLLDRRLEEAIRLGNLDERNLLAIVDQATKLAADTGSADVVPGLTKRLRRGAAGGDGHAEARSNSTPRVGPES